MAQKVMRVLVPETSDALVSNIDALFTVPIMRRYIGWRFDPDQGVAGGWVRKTDPEKIPYRNEYVKAVKDGDLVPADKETAKMCGVPWIQNKRK